MSVLKPRKITEAHSVTNLEAAAMQQRVTRIKQIIARSEAPRLKLRIKNGNSAHYNKVLEITPLGLEGSLRSDEDGFVFFGTLKHS
jgi:hypothetical protein